MRDWMADWRKWSPAERALAIALLMSMMAFDRSITFGPVVMPAGSVLVPPATPAPAPVSGFSAFLKSVLSLFKRGK